MPAEPSRSNRRAPGARPGGRSGTGGGGSRSGSGRASGGAGRSGGAQRGGSGGGRKPPAGGGQRAAVVGPPTTRQRSTGRHLERPALECIGRHDASPRRCSAGVAAEWRDGPAGEAVLREAVFSQPGGLRPGRTVECGDPRRPSARPSHEWPSHERHRPTGRPFGPAHRQDRARRPADESGPGTPRRPVHRPHH